MATNIALTQAQRHSVITLKDIAQLSERTQDRLTTGKRVNSVVDSAVAYFQSKSLSDRSEDFDVKKDGINQAISAMTTALNGVETIDTLLKQMKGMAEASKSQSTEERTTVSLQFIEIGNQVSELIEDTSYQGLNLLSRTQNKMDISFSNRTTSRIIFNGYDLNSTGVDNSRSLFTTAAFDKLLNMRAMSIVIDWGKVTTPPIALGVAGQMVLGFSAMGDLNTGIMLADRVVKFLDTAIYRLRSFASDFGSTIGVLKARLEFTNTYVTDLSIGSDKLTLADLNEEGANLIALNTRQQVGLQALKVSGDQQSAILRLIQ